MKNRISNFMAVIYLSLLEPDPRWSPERCRHYLVGFSSV